MSKRVPKRRFKGFDGKWDKECFDKIFMILSNNSLSRDNLSDTDGEVLNIHYGDVLINYGSILEGNKDRIPRIIGSETYEDNKILIDGDIVIADAAEDNTVGKCCELRNIDKYCVVAGLHTIPCRPMIDFAKYYLGYYLNSESYHNQLLPLIQGTKVSSISKSALNYTYLSYPMQAEQKKLGEFFKNLDNYISLHQQKYDKLQSLKKAYLYEMFPQEGEKVPKRRFPEFSGEWEIKKLSEICSMHARIGWQNLRTSEFLSQGDYYLITGTDFEDGKINYKTCHYVDKFRYEQDKNIQIANGSILITKDGTLGKIALVKDLDKPATLNAGVFNVKIKQDNVDNMYLYQYLKAPFLMDYVTKKSTGGTIKHLNQNILVDFPVLLPKYEEQVKIGEILNNIDKLISKEYTKLQKLKVLKQAYLAEMFV